MHSKVILGCSWGHTIIKITGKVKPCLLSIIIAIISVAVAMKYNHDHPHHLVAETRTL
jgi:hypothetical protein